MNGSPPNAALWLRPFDPDYPPLTWLWCFSVASVKNTEVNYHRNFDTFQHHTTPSICSTVCTVIDHLFNEICGIEQDRVVFTGLNSQHRISNVFNESLWVDIKQGPMENIEYSKRNVNSAFDKNILIQHLQKHCKHGKHILHDSCNSPVSEYLEETEQIRCSHLAVSTSVASHSLPYSTWWQVSPPIVPLH